MASFAACALQLAGKVRKQVRQQADNQAPYLVLLCMLGMTDGDCTGSCTSSAVMIAVHGCNSSTHCMLGQQQAKQLQLCLAN